MDFVGACCFRMVYALVELTDDAIHVRPWQPAACRHIDRRSTSAVVKRNRPANENVAHASQVAAP